MKRASAVQISLGMTAFMLVSAVVTLAHAQDYKTILANPERPEDERKLDAGRKPDEVLKFFGVKPGDKVADIMAGGGYYTAILSQVVGDKGVVYSANNAFMKGFVKDKLDVRLQNPVFANVKHIDGEIDKLALPTDGSLDFVLIHLNYHDLVLKNDNRAAMNKIIFAALKPGGVYGIVDHYAKDGSGSEFTESLHRIDKAVVVKEVNNAGFVLAKEGDMLRHPEDPRTEGVFKHRGETDRFVLRFEKPK
ncbi:MAG TPA: class I SAM-dependent methyltransferase [Candidatus Binatia bacterium]|jgi:predicted methyltransferase|nr:class I SAM-dependent methyltransferase [Candidatus Binatia bacterium]